MATPKMDPIAAKTLAAAQVKVAASNLKAQQIAEESKSVWGLPKMVAIVGATLVGVAVVLFVLKRLARR